MLIIGFILAVVPAIALLFLIYKQDKVEKEPWGLIGKVFLFGVIASIPTIIVEEIFDAPLTAVFGGSSGIYYFLSAFIGVALVEEAFKCLAMFLGAYKKKEFNYTFDGIVYGASAALGFAAIENVLYVCLSSDMFSVAISRAILSVPAHMCFGIIMGFFFGLAKHAKYTGQQSKVATYIVLGLVCPIICHGIFDFILFTGNGMLVTLVYFPFVIAMYVVVFIIVLKSKGKNDKPIPLPSMQGAAPQPGQAIRYCGYCGRQVLLGQNFCSKCGSKL